MTDRHRKIVLGVTGGIAAYKSAEIVRAFKKLGDEVQVAMTRDAARFVTPLTLGTLSERPVLDEIFPEQASGSWTRHVELGLWSDIVVIAPATANTIAKLAHGACDSMLLAVALSARCPVLVCPAMDHDMYLHAATQKNLTDLEAFGYHILPPDHGELASGLIGVGRLPEAEVILAKVDQVLSEGSPPPDLTGANVLVTAGPTRESIDPVRFISNRSTGTMGFELAAAAAERGARVTLVAGSTSLPTPRTVDRVDVESAAEMADTVFGRAVDADMVIMAAAVADYRPAERSDRKMKKSDEARRLELTRTVDILARLGEDKLEGQILIGFALETDNAEENALAKLKSKNLDWIVLNNLREPGAGFGTNTNVVTLISADGAMKGYPKQSKRVLARQLIDRFASHLQETRQSRD